MRKRIFAVFIAAILSFAVFAFSGCGGNATASGDAEPQLLVSEEQVKENLREFLGLDKTPEGNLGNRTPTSESEKVAARRILERYVSDKSDGGADDNAEADDGAEETEPLSENVSADGVFTGRLLDFEFTLTGESSPRKSQNVELKLENERSNGKQVIICTNYDGSYGSADETFTYQRSLGAMDATGVATLFAVMDYVSDHSEEILAATDFDIVFVFFGCGNYNSVGANRYVHTQMSGNDRLNTLAVINVARLGCDRMYIYADETETEQERFVREVASENGLCYYDLPADMPLINALYRSDIYYTHYGMIGDQAVFTECGIPALRIFGGSYGGFNLSDIEKSGEANQSGTETDTYANLVSQRGNFARQGSEAATLILETLVKENFAERMTAARSGMGSYTTWTQPLWAYLIVIFVIIALCIVLIVLVKHFEKKYPFVQQVKRMKIAVFGMEYENKSDGDIFIDIRKGPSDPFDGY